MCSFFGESCHARRACNKKICRVRDMWPGSVPRTRRGMRNLHAKYNNAELETEPYPRATTVCRMGVGSTRRAAQGRHFPNRTRIALLFGPRVARVQLPTNSVHREKKNG